VRAGCNCAIDGHVLIMFNPPCILGARERR
jgi:hypothetical protein